MPPDILHLPDGEQVRYEQRGQGPDVLLIHGTLVTLEDMMIGLGDTLAPHFRVTAVDRPGHGESTRKRFRGTSKDQAKGIRQAVEVLGLHRPVVVGHSAGAGVAVSYGLDFPEDVTGVVSLSGVAYPELRLEHVLYGPRAIPVAGDALAYGPAPLMDGLLDPLLWRAMFLPQAMPRAFKDSFPFALAGKPSDLQATGEEANATVTELLHNLARYPLSPVPMTVMNGDRDLVVNPAHSRVLAQLLRHSRHEQLWGLGHMIHHFAQDRILAAIEEQFTRQH